MANCPNDGTDLLLIPPIVLGEEEAATPVPPVSAPPAEEGTVRAPRTDEPPTDGIYLELVEIPGFRFHVADGQTVGRTDRSDVVLNGVPNFQYISSLMAKITKRGDQWFVQHLANTNYIEVDGERFEDDTEVAIFDGSILNLALCPFIIRVV